MQSRMSNGVSERPGAMLMCMNRLGILYPRGSTLGGSSEVNGMNWALPPDNDWRYIANLTDDESWRPEQMKQYFMELERNEYLPEDVPGHGYDGYVAVCRPSLECELPLKRFWRD